jgi:chemotaxis protein methyltransferase CheR
LHSAARETARDISRTGHPDCAAGRGPFDLVLCRNLVFTYFDDSLQRELARRIAARMRPGAALVIGKHEQLPPGIGSFEAIDAHSRVYRLPTAPGPGKAL